MVTNKRQKNINRKDDKKDIKKASDNEKNCNDTVSEDEKETKKKDLDMDPKDRKRRENK